MKSCEMVYNIKHQTAEALLSSVSMLHIALDGMRLRLMADCEQPPKLPPYMTVLENDGLTFFSFSAGEGGAP